jgi:hypothetical protein
MLARDQLSLTPVARLAAVLPVADPRQQAFQRALAGQLGQAMQAEVLSKLSDGSYVVRVADMAARIPLPQNVQVGAQVPLTLVALNPRPTFQIATAQGGQAFAEAGPPLPEGASPQSSPLAFLEGKEAAALTRAAALLANSQALPASLGGPGDAGAGASLSKAGKALGDVIAAALTSDTQQTAAVGRAPLLGAPSLDAGKIAASLQQGMEKSGLFYESHVAEWAQGTRPQAELAAEPQARGMAPPSDPATAQLINLQLNAHEQARVAWQGQLWPGQDMHWKIERDAPEHGQSGGSDDHEGAGQWQSSLVLRFGQLGEVAAKVVLSGGQLHIRLDAPASVGALLEAGRGRLADALDAAGTPLNTLAIHGNG